MKTFLENLKFPVAAMMCLLLALPAFGASVTITPSAAATNQVLTVAGSITSIVLSGAGAASVKVQLFDGSNTNLTYVVGAYTNYTASVILVTNTYTSIAGGTVTNIYTVVTNAAATVAQSTNNFRTIGAFSVPTNETVTVSYDAANPFFRGIVATNSQAVSITINYLPWR